MKEDEKKAAQEAGCLVRLAAVAEHVANAAYAEEGLHAVVQATHDLVKPQTVAVVLVDQITGDLFIKLSRGLSNQFTSRFSRPLGTGVLAEVVHGGMVLNMTDADADPDARRDVRLECDFGSAVAVGLTINRKPMGYLYADHGDKGHFSREDIQTLRCLTHLAALAVEKAELQSEVARLAVEDPVTGLATYSYFYRRLSDEIERALRYDEGAALMLVEISNLAYIEDVYGRPGALEAIKCVARRVRESTRGIDFAARFRTNELMICLVRANEEGLAAVGRRIISAAGAAALSCQVPQPGQEIPSGAPEIEITLVAGGAVVPRHGRDAGVLVSVVEKALLAAKRAGGGLSIAQ